MIIKISQFLQLSIKKDNSFECRLYPEPLTTRIKKDNGLSAVKTGQAIWTPLGLGEFRYYNEAEEMVNVYIPRFGCTRPFSPHLVYRMVAYIPDKGQVIPLNQEDYKYLIVKSDFSEFPIRVRIARHGRGYLTLTDKEKQKRKLIAILNTTHNSNGRKIMMQILNKKINIYSK